MFQPVARGANRRLNDDVCRSPPRRSTRATKVGEIRVRADAAQIGNPAKPKLKKLRDEVLHSASRTSLGEEGDQTVGVSTYCNLLISYFLQVFTSFY